MPDDSRVAGIADALESDDSEESDESRASQEAHDSEGSQTSRGVEVQRSQGWAAFSTEEAEKTSVYGTPETLEDYRTMVRVAMGRAESRGLQDATAREVHNAALRIAKRDVKEIVDEMEAVRER